MKTAPMDFYPRPPRGGRPDQRRPSAACYQDFYPRPPRGGRPLTPEKVSDKRISIHALREEGDSVWEGTKGLGGEFLSTPSARRATILPRKEVGTHEHFYPRPPRGGRLLLCHVYAVLCGFLSTPSARRATAPLFRFSLLCRISIHALREEGD